MSGSSGRSVMGRVREALGWATADRREEAKGQLQQLDAEGAGTDDDRPEHRADEVLDEAELKVRADHGDLHPDAEPDDPAPKDPPTPG